MSNTDVSKNAVYAILADSVYWDVRYGENDGIIDQANSNWTPVPTGWELIKEVSGSGDIGRASNPDLAGFTARAYKNGNFS